MMPSFTFALVATGAQAGEHACSAHRAQGLFDALFSSLGNDCDTYMELFAEGAQYYHQHDGHKTYSELRANCDGFAKAFPAGSQAFQQAGSTLTLMRPSSDGDCHFMVPYLWSAIPAQDGMPHTGWEFIKARQDGSSRFGYKINHFAEIETTFTAAFNWHNPRATPALFTDSTLAELHATTSDTIDACDNPLADTLTDFLEQRAVRQQGDAVLLAAGGLCQVAVPFAGVHDQDGLLFSGYYVLSLEKNNDSYNINDSSLFFENGPTSISNRLSVV
jgi:hypothetical protein